MKIPLLLLAAAIVLAHPRPAPAPGLVPPQGRQAPWAYAAHAYPDRDAYDDYPAALARTLRRRDEAAAALLRERAAVERERVKSGTGEIQKRKHRRAVPFRS